MRPIRLPMMMTMTKGAAIGGSGAKRTSGQTKSKTPVLDNFGRDVTRLAEEGS